ncbi:MAG: citrate transporter [Emcibacter sp.]|nr:citrate transporter [Emcibacter sp.]
MAFLGFATIILFTILVMKKKVSAVAGLILFPIIFALLGGFGTEIGGMMIAGILQTSPTAVMLVFALLYFMIMYESGLFEPFICRILAIVGEDPVKIVVGTALLVMIVSFDGDGASAVLITISAMYPIYRRVGVNPLIMALMLALISPLMNWLPWGGPAARAAISLNVDVADIVVPMIPALVISLLATLVFAYILGRSERRRLQSNGAEKLKYRSEDSDFHEPRPQMETKNFWFNLTLTIALMVGLALNFVPLPALVMAAFALALTVNYPDVKKQQECLKPHAGTALTLVTLILAAGSFTGILSETGMVDAMAGSFLAIVPESWGGHFGFVTALLSMPLLIILSTDGFFLGVLPVLGQTGLAYGVPAEVIARASLIGMPCHSISPLIPAIYFVATLLKTDIGSLQRFAWPWTFALSFIALIAATLTGAIYAV